jgi:hypothetical protein
MHACMHVNMRAGTHTYMLETCGSIASMRSGVRVSLWDLLQRLLILPTQRTCAKSTGWDQFSSEVVSVSLSLSLSLMCFASHCLSWPCQGRRGLGRKGLRRRCGPRWHVRDRRFCHGSFGRQLPCVGPLLATHKPLRFIGNS